jgi:hypothetical protein
VAEIMAGLDEIREDLAQAMDAIADLVDEVAPLAERVAALSVAVDETNAWDRSLHPVVERVSEQLRTIEVEVADRVASLGEWLEHRLDGLAGLAEGSTGPGATLDADAGYAGEHLAGNGTTAVVIRLDRIESALVDLGADLRAFGPPGESAMLRPSPNEDIGGVTADESREFWAEGPRDWSAPLLPDAQHEEEPEVPEPTGPGPSWIESDPLASLDTWVPGGPAPEVPDVEAPPAWSADAWWKESSTAVTGPNAPGAHPEPDAAPEPAGKGRIKRRKRGRQ